MVHLVVKTCVKQFLVQIFAYSALRGAHACAPIQGRCQAGRGWTFPVVARGPVGAVRPRERPLKACIVHCAWMNENVVLGMRMNQMVWYWT